MAISEPDWDTCTVAGGDPQVGALVLSNWIPGRSRNPRVGRALDGMVSRAGLAKVDAWAASVTDADFTAAAEVFPLAGAARQAVHDSLISQDQVDSWR